MIKSMLVTVVLLLNFESRDTHIYARLIMILFHSSYELKATHIKFQTSLKYIDQVSYDVYVSVCVQGALMFTL